MHKISTLTGREILDSRGLPTIEIDLVLDDGSYGRGMVPSGASTGTHEAHEKRDGDVLRFNGKGVIGVLDSLLDIRPLLIGVTFSQESLDTLLCRIDNTEQKTVLGANLILGISLAFAQASAQSANIPLWRYFNQMLGTDTLPKLPTPLINVLNGGAHASEGLDIQEVMIVPRGQLPFREKLRRCAEIFQSLKASAKQQGYPTTVGDEGGLALSFKNAEEAFAFLTTAIKDAGYTTETIAFALDVAASELQNERPEYIFKKESKKYTAKELLQLYTEWISRYPIISIEDGFAEDDWEAWNNATKTIGTTIQLVGDDLFTTNKKRLLEGISQKSANAILIKPNQIGTISETLDVIRTAQANNFAVVVSHRSGETEDVTIAHLAVGVGAEYIKTGSTCRSERVAKYNELLRIAETLEHD